MQMIAVEEAKPGMVLAKPILRKIDGLVLLQDNIILKQNYIEKIKTLNLDSIWVKDLGESDESDVLEPIREETRLKATAILRTTFNQCKQEQTIDTVKLKEVVKEILDYILSDLRIVYSLTKINNYDNYTFTHSVDVCVLSVLIGSVMGISRNELEILGISAMLHDIGKIFSDFRILNKPAKLKPDEYELIKTHTRDGYELLKKRGNVSFLVPHMALQHHERENGSGYPRGLSSRRIHRFAKIIAVADVFDAMTSQRIYQNPVSFQAAIEDIRNHTPLQYNQSVVESLTKIITPYERGSKLMLSNHQKVEVTSISRTKCLVRVVSGYPEGEIFDLYKKPELSVVRVL